MSRPYRSVGPPVAATAADSRKPAPPAIPSTAKTMPASASSPAQIVPPFHRIMAAGGFISVRTGSAQDANCLPVSKEAADAAMDAAECIGCGACVATCKNASAMLFVSAKAGQLNSLPQGQPEKHRRVLGMVKTMDESGFGNCTNQYECEAACPKEISVRWIAKLNRDYAAAVVHESLLAPVGKGKGDGAG